MVASSVAPFYVVLSRNLCSTVASSAAPFCVVLHPVVILRSFRDRVEVLQVSVPLSLSLSRHHTFVRYKATYPLLAANYLGCRAYCRKDWAIPGPFFEAVPISAPDQSRPTLVRVRAGSPALTPRHMSKPRPNWADVTSTEPTDFTQPRPHVTQSFFMVRAAILIKRQLFLMNSTILQVWTQSFWHTFLRFFAQSFC
jgi:hypothetical protein